MPYQITVLGAGLVGRAMIRDLAADRHMQVRAVDVSKQALQAVSRLSHVSCVVADLTDRDALAAAISDADLVLCAVPGWMGFKTLRTILEEGKHVVDISFFPEDPRSLESLATKQQVVAITDCGVAPGLCNIQAGFVKARSSGIRSYLCYVGGLPRQRVLPWEYKAVFSPADVIEEYVRPARYVEGGTLITRKALTDIEHIDFEGVGTLEAFNTDGLRSLIHTLGAPDMKEKTLRYPGHADLMRTFRDAGFFDDTPIRLGQHEVRPLELTSALLFEQWKLQPGQEDFTVMRVDMEAEEKDGILRHRFELFDTYDLASGVHSMARTTGYTATSVARLVLSGAYTRPGISPPEWVGESEGCYELLLKDLELRNIHIRHTIEP